MVLLRNAMQKSNPVFLRYLFILFLFSALLCLLFVPVYLYIFNFTLENELALIYNRLHWGVSSLDAAINAINNTAILTNRDPRFRIFTLDRQDLARNPVLLNELRNYFGGLLLSYPVIADAGIIFSRTLVLTRQHIYFYPDLIDPFYANYIQCENISEDEWYSMLAKTNTLSSVNSYTSMGYNTYEGLTYSVQWRTAEVPDIYIMYSVFQTKNILTILAEDVILYQSSIRISDQKDNSLYFYQGDKYNSNDKFHTLKDRSAVTSIFFELMVPESVINAKMTPVRRLMTGFALITVFFSVCISLFFAYKWSEPMRRLLLNIDSTKIFKNEYEQNIEPADFGLWNYFRRFYASVSNSISVMDNRLDDSLRTIESQSSLLKEQIFYKALYQGIYSEHDERLFKSLFTDFPAFFQLALISYDQPADSSLEKTAVIQLQLIGAIKSHIGDIFIHSIVENMVILLLPLREKNESWYVKLQDLRDSLNQQIDLALHFSLSGAYEKPPDLPKAWQELKSISIASGIENLVSIGQTRDIPNFPHQIPLNITKVNMIYNALNNGNDDTACNILAEGTAELVRERDMFILGSISNLLHNMLVLLKRENQAILANEEIPQYIPGREAELLETQFPDCFCRIGKLVRQSREESLSQFGGRILDFINQNLYNPALYSTMVQNHFNISQPTLQKLIKQLTGLTYLSYVETRRLSRARELLSEGTCTIHEVSIKCGFSNTNSFYKAFKRLYGFPPSDIKSGVKNGIKH